MGVSIGRVEVCPVMGLKFFCLAHNTVRGAAGAAILNAEYLVSKVRIMKGTAQIFINQWVSLGARLNKPHTGRWALDIVLNGLNHRLSFLHQSVTDDVVRTG